LRWKLTSDWLPLATPTPSKNDEDLQQEQQLDQDDLEEGDSEDTDTNPETAPPPPTPPDTPPPPAAGAPAHEETGFWTTQRKRIALTAAILAIPALLLAMWSLGAFAGRGKPDASGPSRLGGGQAQPPQGPTTAASLIPEVGAAPGVGNHICAYVKGDPSNPTVPVYSEADTTSRQVKWKAVGDPVEILDLPHPPGWTVVFTPQNPPGRLWMQTSELDKPFRATRCPTERR
jgi:hypothetical protein